jgi:hypothetical protein
MGFFSDIMKNPFVQMATPFALSAVMPHLGITGMLGGIKNPMLRSAIEQSLIGGTRALMMRDKHPGRAAMYAGLGSMPFSFMKANAVADAYNKKYVGEGAADLYKTHGTKIMTDPGRAAQEAFYSGPGGLEQTLGVGTYNPAVTAIEPSYGKLRGAPWSIPEGFKQPTKIDAWDVLGGKTYDIPEARNMALTGVGDPVFSEAGDDILGWTPETAWDATQSRIPAQEGYMPAEDFDFYSKVGKGGKNLLGQTLTEDKTYTDYLPTVGAQTAGWIAGQPDADEREEERRMANRRRMAEMYGIPEHLLGGLMENPYDTGSFWKDGGIATLEMDAGGAVNGPGGPKDDVIDAKLSDGEFVMTAKAVENLGGGNRLAGAKQMYNMMNQLDPQSETVQESVIGVA